MMALSSSGWNYLRFRVVTAVAVRFLANNLELEAAYVRFLLCILQM